MKIGLFDLNKSAFNKSRYEYPEIDLMKVYSYYNRNKQNVIELSLDLILFCSSIKSFIEFLMKK